MKAAYYERKGPARDVLQHGDVPDPEAPGTGEVRVRLRFSSVNPSDVKLRGGWDGELRMPFPRIIPHQDGAGVIEAAGPGVAASRMGEQVWIYEGQRGRPFGTAAELVVVPAENAVRVPDGADLETAACLGVPAMTAHRCLFADGPVHSQTVLVAGGGGAVGNAAIQLARWGGARVITTVSRPEQEAVARAAGADLVLDRRKQDVTRHVLEFTGGGGVDRVVEVAFGENVDLDRAVLRPNGVLSVYGSGGAAADRPSLPVRQFMMHGITVHFVGVYTMPLEAHRQAARDINAALGEGKFRTNIGHRFSLEEIAAAHEAQERGELVGKVLIRLR